MLQGLRSFRGSRARGVAARTLWANSNGNFVRVIDPIALATVDEIASLRTQVDGTR